MAAFTTMALLGLGLAGGLAASKLKKKPLAPGPVPTAVAPPAVQPPVAPLPPPIPIDAARARSDAQNPAIAAAKKTRAKAGTPSSTLLGSAPSATASLQPKTLLGYGKGPM